MIIIFSGSSGVGKSSVINELLKKLPGSEIFKSYSTRKPRFKGENSYIFISKKQFEKKIEQGEMLEWNLYSGNYYGFGKKEFDEAMKSNNYLLKDIDVVGFTNLKKYVKNNQNLISIFLTAPIELLEKRLINRGDTFDIEKRLERFEYEQTFSKNYDFVVESLDTKYSVPEILNILKTLKGGDFE